MSKKVGKPWRGTTRTYKTAKRDRKGIPSWKRIAYRLPRPPK
jgi:hypothetical protein